MKPDARLFTVHGRVQGVWFRDSTRREAVRLGISGHAINLPNGNVEVLAVGAAAQLDVLEAWLHEGPPMALVTKVERRTAELSSHGGQWALPGGRIDVGESAEQAALRELDEEVGLTLPPESVLGLLNYPEVITLMNDDLDWTWMIVPGA